jgi:hypothetical protein
MKTKTQAAQCAALIRAELKEKFPLTKFKVNSENYSMGDNVNISWIDGAAENEVEELLAKYQYGRFNGMEDLYEYTNCRDDIAQTKYLFCNRTISNEIYLAKFEELKQTWDILKDITDINATNSYLFANCNCWTARQFVYKRSDGFRKVDLTKPKTISIKEELKEEKKLNALLDAGKLGCKLVDYSEKAVAVFGNTKPIKDKLKELGGRFNPFLNNNGEKMAGWIFPKAKLAELQLILN